MYLSATAKVPESTATHKNDAQLRTECRRTQPKQINAGPSNVDVYLRPSPGQCQSYRAAEHAEQPEFCRLAGLQ